MRPDKHKPFYRKNETIRAVEVHLIDEDGVSFGNIPRSEALSIGAERGLDVVEIGPTATPPVCKLLDFGKFIYEMEKKGQKNKPNKAGEIKEIRLGIKTDEHDFNTKIEHAKKFIEKGHKIKVTVKMMGRENIYHEKALDQINRVKEALGLEFEQPAQRLGNRFNALLIKSRNKRNDDAKA